MRQNVYDMACNPIFFVILDSKRTKELIPRPGYSKGR